MLISKSKAVPVKALYSENYSPSLPLTGSVDGSHLVTDTLAEKGEKEQKRTFAWRI
jgi:hypothetical protein